MSESDPTPEHGLPPDALALPDDFWESPLPPVVTEVPAFDAPPEMVDLDLAVDLSLPGEGVGDDAVAPVSASVEPPSDLSVWAPGATDDAGRPEDSSPWVFAETPSPPADRAEEQPPFDLLMTPAPVVAADGPVDPWDGVWADDLRANANAEPDGPVTEPPADRTVAAMWDEDAAVPAAIHPDPDVAAEPATPVDPAPDQPPVDLSLAALPSESADADAVADSSLWFWAEDGIDDLNGHEASAERPADLTVADVGADDLDDMEPVHPVPATVGATSVAPLRRWRERWEGNGARVAAVTVLFVAVAAVAAFLGRPDSPGSGPIELAGPTETTVKPPARRSPTTTAAVPISAGVPASADAPAAPGGSVAGAPAAGPGRGGGGARPASVNEPVVGGAGGAAPAPAPAPSPGGGGGEGGGGEAPAPTPAAGPAPEPAPTGGSTAWWQRAVPRDPPAEDVRPRPVPAPTPAPEPSPPPTVPEEAEGPDIPCEYLPAGRLGCPE